MDELNDEQQSGETIDSPARFIERRSVAPGSSPFRFESGPFRQTGPTLALKALSPPLQQALQPDDDMSSTPLQHLLDVLRRHKWAIVSCVVLGISIGAIATEFLQPLYKSTVKINVERRGNGAFVGQQATTSAISTDMDQMMTTQVEIVESDPVLRPATESYHLLDVEKQFEWLQPGEAARLRAAPIKLKRLKVERENNTYLIDISYKAADPQLAANVANMIGATYLEHAFDSRDRSYVQVSAVIARQLAELHNKMAASDQALTKFNEQMNIIDPEQRVSMLSARLLEQDKDYVDAQSDRLRKQAVFDATKAGNLASAQVSTHAASLEAVVHDLNVARQEFAVVRTTYADNHPEYIKAKSKLTELETQFQEMRTNAMQRVEEDYKQALAREEMAHELAAETKNEVDGINSKAVEYQRLKDEAQTYRKVYADLERVTGEEDINRSFQDAVIQIEEPARAAAQQIFPVMWLNLLIASLLSGLGGIAGVLLYDSLDKKLHTPADAADKLNIEVIASLPKLKRSLSFGGPARSGRVVGKMPKSERTKMLTQYHESIRSLRNSIEFIQLDQPLRSLLVTSAMPGEGKSTIAANLAFSYALLGKKVLLIDADMRSPSLHLTFEKKFAEGFAELLEEKTTLSSTLIKIAREHLFLIPAGMMSDRSADMVTTGAAHLLEQAYAEFDLVILDSPPLLAAPEAAQLASIVDGVLVASRADFSSANKVNEAYSLLKRAHARVVGMVMDDVSEGGLINYGRAVPLLMPKSA